MYRGMQPGNMGIIPQHVYANYLRESEESVREFAKKLPEAELAKMKAFKNRPREDAYGKALEDRADSVRAQYAKALLKERIYEIQKAGVNTGLGYNFFDLRGPAYLLYPVLTPFRNMLPRWGRVNDGYGVAANWKATRNFGTAYAGAAEGKRVSTATPDENNYVATYKEIGVERAVTFTAQFAGEGYTDNVADEHLRGLHELWLQEEGLMLLGNSGTATGNNGFLLGTAPTPVAVLVATSTGNVPAGPVSFRVVALTALANPNNTQYGYGLFPTVTSGLTPSYVRTNADNSQDTINGGTSAISLASNVVTADGTHKQVTVSCAAVKGAFAYAWYVDLTDSSAPTAANAILTAITNFPSYTFNLAAAAGTQTGAATGLNADHSAQALDFDGLLSYAASTAGALYNDMAGGTLTPNHDGTVVEIESDLETIWNNYQTQPTAMWMSADAKVALSKAIRAGGTNPSAYRFDYARDEQNNLLGGYVVSAYQSQFSIEKNGGNALPMRIHPQLPPGTIYYDLDENPYPHSRIPGVRGMLVQRDYYGIEWPLTTRTWTFGEYVHEVLAMYLPWIPGVRCGIGGASS